MLVTTKIDNFNREKMIHQLKDLYKNQNFDFFKEINIDIKNINHATKLKKYLETNFDSKK